MGALEYGTRSYLQRSSLLNVKPGDIGLPTGFMENFNAAVEDFDFNYKSTSRTNILEPVIDDQLKKIYQSENPDIRFKPSYHKEEEWNPIDIDAHTDFTTTDFLENGELTGTFKQRQSAYRDLTPYILGLQKKYPDAGIKTYDQIMDDARNKAQIIKEKLETITDNRTWGGVVGNLSGVMKSAITDPIVVASMAFGLGKITGSTKGVNALKAFLTEFFIGAGSESIIQLAPGLVKDWQAELEQPWTLKQAAITILTVGGFAGVTRAGGSYVVDIVEAGKASKILRAKGETAKADVLDNFIDLYQSAPRAADVLNDEAHFKALDDIQRALDEGKVGAELNAEVERILADTEGRPEFRINTKGEVEIERSLIDVNRENFGYPEIKSVLKDDDPLILKDSKARNTTKKGTYYVKRQKLHRRIIDGFLNEGIVAGKGERPIAILMGGGSASGKGTILQLLQTKGKIPKKGYVHIDPDLIKTGTPTTKGIPAYKTIKDAGDHRAANLVHRESTDIADQLRIEAMKDKRHIVIDKTLGNPKKAKALIQELKDAGYEVQLIGVTLDPGEALVRNLVRYFSSRRLVTPQALLKRHKGFNKNFKQYAKMVSEARLYDNTGKTPTKVATFIDGKAKIVSKEEYNKLTARGKLNDKATTFQQLQESQGLPPRLVGGSRQIDGQPKAGGVPKGTRPTDQRAETQIDTGTRPVLDDPELNRLMDEELIEAQRIIDEAGDDLEVPFTLIDDLGNEVTIVEGVKKVFNDLDEEKKSLDSLNKCMGRAA